jgi:formate dehydrogenase major subunit
VPLDSTAEGSHTPTSKSVVVRLERPGGRRNGVIREATTDAGSDTGHKRQTDPVHQS